MKNIPFSSKQISSSLTSSGSGGWHLGSFPCRANSFLMESVPVAHTLLLLHLVVDRVVAVRDPQRYKKSTRRHRRLLWVALLYWAVAAASAILLLVPPYLVESWPFPHRYSCQVMSLTYTVQFMYVHDFLPNYWR